jgi:metal-sulfur cluster biosynthetic enzyme/nitrite reductase/ring-hydroxylating ferredoxin subunit
MAALEKIAEASELAVGARTSVFVDDTPALLVRLSDTEYACIEDVCTHDGNPLTDGPIAGGEITCPRHGARFDLRTGKALCMPATEAVTTFAVEIRPDGIYARPKSAELPNTVRAAPTSAAAPQPATTLASSQPTIDPNTGEPSLTDEGKLVEALREVIDPELMINIIDLGLVYGINYHPDRRVVDVEMTLTSPACPAGPQIIQQSKMALERLAGVQQAQIKLVMSPPWTPERMTDEARDQLGIF